MIGLVGAAGLTRLMATLLYGVPAVDPITYGAAAALAAAVPLLATHIPACTASRVDPMAALRAK